MCENTTLDALLGGMSELEVNLAMFDLAEGLRYLHEEARVLHRNIRGQSVLMRGCRYLISDFSEAEVLAAGARIRGLAGKKYCMSPEMLAEQPYNFPSDIWALGILFAELMVGIPFRTMENKIAALLPDFPESFLPRIGESWKKQLLRGMFQKDPDKRFCISEVQKRLKAQLNDPWKHEACPEVRRFSEASRLLVDKDRHLFVQKRFQTNILESEAALQVKRYLAAVHPNVVAVQQIRLKEGECEATLQYCCSGPLISLFSQLHENQVLEVIGGIWRGFQYLQEHKLLLADNLSLQHILVSEARPKLQLFTEKTFGLEVDNQDGYGLQEVARLFLELLMREQLELERVKSMVASKDGLGLKERELEGIIVGIFHSDKASRLNNKQVHQRLTAFLEAKQQEETMISYRNYRVISEIAYGAFGKVYLAENPDKQQYAVKIIPCRLESDRFEAQQQAQNLSRTNHLGIVKLYESFLNDSKTEMVLVMECCEQNTLKETVPNLTPEHRMQAIRELCEAVRYLHEELGMVHRDIKPANILIRDGHIKLCDFGRSKFLKPGQTITGVVGTTYYMPPEMANLEQYGFSVDIWNLGIVLLEVCLGRITCRNSIAFMDPAFPQNYLTEIDDMQLRELLAGMIQRKPSNRLTIKEIQRLFS